MQKAAMLRNLLAFSLTIVWAFAGVTTVEKLSIKVYARDKVHQWQKGMLTDITSRDASRMIEGTSHERSYWTYSVDDGKYIWKLQRDMRHRDKPLEVTVNTQVDFSIEGQKAYMKDETGKEHELSVQVKTLKVEP